MQQNDSLADGYPMVAPAILLWPPRRTRVPLVCHLSQAPLLTAHGPPND